MVQWLTYGAARQCAYQHAYQLDKSVAKRLHAGGQVWIQNTQQYAKRNRYQNLKIQLRVPGLFHRYAFVVMVMAIVMAILPVR